MRCCWPRTTTRSSTSRRRLPTHRSTTGFCQGLRHAVRLDSAPNAFTNSGVGIAHAETSEITGYRGLGYRETELLEFAQDPRGAPVVFSDHPANQVTDLALDSRTARARPSLRDSRPVAAEASALPVHHCCGCHDYQPVGPVGRRPAERDPERPVGVMQPRLVFSQLQRGDLLPEGEVLED